ncbi:amidohydrolase family protein, partial [Glutamicibacter creatinolyticus]|uniref:amidohydrolase family protein n=1 Tax=Glutamicibacter creatinolyticus TaxID=162496 RepID=UPI003B981051
MALTLYRNGSIYSSADPFATAMMIDGNTVAWIGGEEAADRQAERADEVIDLEGGLVTPAFVDSHTHLADLGAVLAGEDLSAGRSPEDLVARLRELAGATEGQILTAHGWDETR